MRLLISGGGTGGHLSPALAVAQAFRAERPHDELLIIGKSRGPEERMVPEAGFELATIPIVGFNRDEWWENAALPVLLPLAFMRALRIVDRFRPDVVLGTGPYVMVPALIAARLRGIPYVLLAGEAGGLANRMMSPWAAACCVAFAGSERRLRRARRVVVTGYPIRDGFKPGQPRVPPRRLLVMGGSMGARHLNQVVWDALDQLCERFEEVVHLTGVNGAGEIERHHRSGYRPLVFSDRVQELMAESDLIVCRAGVSTFSEFTAAGLPAIVVPGAFGGGHQEENAAALQEAGVAVTIGDGELTAARLVEVINSLGPDRLRRMASASRAFGSPDAARRVLAVVEEVAGS